MPRRCVLRSVLLSGVVTAPRIRLPTGEPWFRLSSCFGPFTGTLKRDNGAATLTKTVLLGRCIWYLLAEMAPHPAQLESCNGGFGISSPTIACYSCLASKFLPASETPWPVCNPLSVCSPLLVCLAFFPLSLSQLARCAHLTRQWRRAADPASTYPRPPTRLFWSRRCGERGVLCGVELPGFSQSRRSACAAKTLRPTFEADIITLETVVRALRRWGPATQCLGKLLNS